MSPNSASFLRLMLNMKNSFKQITVLSSLIIGTLPFYSFANDDDLERIRKLPVNPGKAQGCARLVAGDLPQLQSPQSVKLKNGNVSFTVATEIKRSLSGLGQDYSQDEISILDFERLRDIPLPAWKVEKYTAHQGSPYLILDLGWGPISVWKDPDTDDLPLSQKLLKATDSWGTSPPPDGLMAICDGWRSAIDCVGYSSRNSGRTSCTGPKSGTESGVYTSTGARRNSVSIFRAVDRVGASGCYRRSRRGVISDSRHSFTPTNL